MARCYASALTLDRGDSSAEHLARARGQSPRDARQLFATDDPLVAETRSQPPAYRGHERAAAGREHAIDLARVDPRPREHVVEHAIDRREIFGDPVSNAGARSAGRA